MAAKSTKITKGSIFAPLVLFVAILNPALFVAIV
jgi:hypothetical protein